MTAHGHFHWNELMSWDVEKAKTFYADTLGWTYQAMPMGPGGTYWVAMEGDKAIGGMYQMVGKDFDGMPEAWCPYIAVDDIDARVAKATAAGASVMGEVFDAPQIGRMAMIREPGGALVGWITPAAQ